MSKVLRLLPLSCSVRIRDDVHGWVGGLARGNSRPEAGRPAGARGPSIPIGSGTRVTFREGPGKPGPIWGQRPSPILVKPPGWGTRGNHPFGTRVPGQYGKTRVLTGACWGSLARGAGPPPLFFSLSFSLGTDQRRGCSHAAV